MRILILNGSPRRNGNTASLVKAFREGAEEAGHEVNTFDVYYMNIRGCLACESCHKDNSRVCVINDDMHSIYPLLDSSDMLALASPIYYHHLTGPLQCTLSRIYALDKPRSLKMAALILSSEANSVYAGAIYSYERSFLDYLRLNNAGIFLYSEKERARFNEKLEEIRSFGRGLRLIEGENNEEANNNSISNGGSNTIVSK